VLCSLHPFPCSFSTKAIYEDGPWIATTHFHLNTPRNCHAQRVPSSNYNSGSLCSWIVSGTMTSSALSPPEEADQISLISPQKRKFAALDSVEKQEVNGITPEPPASSPTLAEKVVVPLEKSFLDDLFVVLKRYVPILPDRKRIIS
jgi:hypothetical protein